MADKFVWKKTFRLQGVREPVKKEVVRRGNRYHGFEDTLYVKSFSTKASAMNWLKKRPL